MARIDHPIEPPVPPDPAGDQHGNGSSPSPALLSHLGQLAQEAGRRHDEAESLLRELQAGSDSPDLTRRVSDQLHAGGGVAGLLSQVGALVSALPPEQAADARVDAAQQALAALTRRVLDPAQPSGQGQALLAALEERRQRERDVGGIAPGHEAAWDDALAEIASTLGAQDKDLAGTMSDADRLLQFVTAWIESAHYLTHHIPRPPAGSRAAALVEMNWLLRRHLMLLGIRSDKGEDTSREALGLSSRASILDRRIYEACADDGLAGVTEVEGLHALAVAVRNLSVRAHVMLARPIWESAAPSIDPTLLFHSGPPDGAAFVENACRRAGLHLPARVAGDAYAQQRWDQLQQALVAVFDLRAASDRERCSVCYELGIALALGRPIVVVTSAGSKPPFDIDIAPVEVAGGDSGSGLADAIDRAVCWTLPTPTGQPWHATLSHALAAYDMPTGDLYIDQTVKLLREGRARSDPLVTSRLLERILAHRHEGRARLIYPRWSPTYPAPERGPRLFHVMPFGPSWAKRVAAAAREACGTGAIYVRGDEASNPNVIRSIWEEIARATHVLVDLTGFNPNVALELGIAHTLGRPVLIVGQDDTKDHLPPSIGRERVQPYRLRALKRSLGGLVKRFLADEGPPTKPGEDP